MSDLDYGLPSSEHVETMFNGLEDLINGESTYNTRYAGGVLMACGVVTSRQVSGNESFLDSVGSGIKKVWEYIMKTVRSIWAVFFGAPGAKVLKEKLKIIEKEIRGGNVEIRTSTKDFNAETSALKKLLDRLKDQNRKDEVTDVVLDLVGVFNYDVDFSSKEDSLKFFDSFAKPISEVERVEGKIQDRLKELDKEVTKTDKEFKKFKGNDGSRESKELKDKLKELKEETTDLSEVSNVVRKTIRISNSLVDKYVSTWKLNQDALDRIEEHNSKFFDWVK